MAKRNVPPTSRTAHHSMKDANLVQQKQILKALRTIRDHKGNYQKIAKYAGLDSIAVASRLSELTGKGLIHPTNEVSMSASGRPCTVYVLDKKAA